MDLEELRRRIDEIDTQIMVLLMKRFAVVEQVGGLKQSEGKDVFDDDREKEVIRNCIEKGKGMDEMFIRDICRLILEESKRIQK